MKNLVEEFKAALEVHSKEVQKKVITALSELDVFTISLEVQVPARPVFEDFGLSPNLATTLVFQASTTQAKFYYNSMPVKPVLLGKYFLGEMPQLDLLQILEQCGKQNTACPEFNA